MVNVGKSTSPMDPVVGVFPFSKANKCCKGNCRRQFRSEVCEVFVALRILGMLWGVKLTPFLRP